jgi:hypothetical protein
MRRLAPLLLFCCIAPAEDPVVVEDVGFSIEMPDDWSREMRREKDSIRFAAIFDHTKKLFVRFQVETSDAKGYDAAAWLEVQKQATAKWFKEVQEPFAVEKGTVVGGRDAVAFTCSGRTAQGAEEYDMRLHVAALVHGGTFFQFTEVSYNKAHEVEEVADAIARLWKGIRFQEPKAPPINLDVPEGAAEQELLDQTGNYKLKVPPGWTIKQPPNPDPKVTVRAAITRTDSDGNGLATITVLRFEESDTAIFATGTAGEVLTNIAKNGKFFEQFFGEGSAGFIHPRVNEGVSLGGVEKAGAFEYRSITMEEQEEIRKAEDLQRRGEKGIQVPQFKETVVRGRIGLLSPAIYVAVGNFQKELADDPDLLKEYNRVLDSWEFLVSEAIPPALTVGDLEIGDTLSDPANTKARKSSSIAMHKERTAYRIQVDFVLPPGFQEVPRDLIKRIYQDPDKISVLVVAQDKSHNWVQIMITHSNDNALGEIKMTLGDKKQAFETWESNWLGKAPTAKFPARTKKFNIGNVRGEGYDRVPGVIDKFRGTFTGLVDDKSSWRTAVTIETRAKGDSVFKEGIEDFCRSVKLKPLKKG